MRKLFLGTVLALLLGLGMAVGGIAVSGCSAISWQVRAGAAAMGLAGTGVAVAAPTVFYHGRNRDGSPVHFAHSQKGATWFSYGTRGPYPRRW